MKTSVIIVLALILLYPLTSEAQSRRKVNKEVRKTLKIVKKDLNRIKDVVGTGESIDDLLKDCEESGYKPKDEDGNYEEGRYKANYMASVILDRLCANFEKLHQLLPKSSVRKKALKNAVDKFIALPHS